MSNIAPPQIVWMAEKIADAIETAASAPNGCMLTATAVLAVLAATVIILWPIIQEDRHK